jgi:hypothetical protein
MNWLASLSTDLERSGFSTERTAVPFLNPNSKPRFSPLLSPYSIPVFEGKIKSYLLFPQISL